MSRTPKRDISPILKKMRDIVLGRDHTNALRFEQECSDRDQPPPSIPDGPAHKLSANYYLDRDPRRDVEPPIVLSKKLIASAESKIVPAATRVSGVPTPGKIFKWDY